MAPVLCVSVLNVTVKVASGAAPYKVLGILPHPESRKKGKNLQLCLWAWVSD